MSYLYLTPELYSTTYPPVDSDFKHPVTDLWSMDYRTQMLSSIRDDTTVFVDKQFYAFKYSQGSQISINLYINGVTQNKQLGPLSAWDIPSDTIIYGYTVSPDRVNLWTDPTYIDKTQDLMYGRRGLYLKPYSDDIYDLAVRNSDTKVAIMHGYDNNALIITKGTSNSQTVCRLSVGFSGNYESSNMAINPKFAVRSQIISTGTLDQEVAKLQETVSGLETQINQIQQEVERIIPDLTKLVSSEASKNYVAR